MLRWLIVAASLCALGCETYKGKLEFFKSLSFVVNMSQSDLELLPVCARQGENLTRACKKLYNKRKKNTRSFNAGAHMAQVESTDSEVKFKIFSVGRKKPQKFSLGVPKEFFWGESEFELPAYMSGLPFDVYGEVEVLDQSISPPVSEWETCTRQVPHYSCYSVRVALPPTSCRWPPCYTWRRVCGTRYRMVWGQRWVSYQVERVRKKLYVEFHEVEAAPAPRSLRQPEQRAMFQADRLQADGFQPNGGEVEVLGQFDGLYTGEKRVYGHRGYCQWNYGRYPYY